MMDLSALLVTSSTGQLSAQTQVNREWAQCLIDLLIGQGVDYFCSAPGNRSMPLLAAIAQHPRAQYTVHFDERGLGFHALGYAKATLCPAVIVVTSGTAVGNLLPALMEADQAGVPLIVLTADRPPELLGCGANQTTDQIKLFANVVRWQVDLPCPDKSLGINYLSSTIGHAVMRARQLKGPVHINCPFREPLTGESQHSAMPLKHVVHSESECNLSQKSVDAWGRTLGGIEKGILLVGSGSEVGAEDIFALAQKLQWPILADILAPVRAHAHPLSIAHYDFILQKEPAAPLDAVVQIGERFVSKTLDTWLKAREPKLYVQVTSDLERRDPSHLVTHRVHTSARAFVQQLTAALPHKEGGEFVERWKEDNATCARAIQHFFAEDTRLSEPRLIASIPELLSSEWALFLGNSMPIRDANQLLTSTRGMPVFANRGVSGIDGNIATAAGIARGLKRPLCIVLGDLALLHDLNSLPLVHQVNTPIIICVINNGGGGIFSFLPCMENKEHFETFVAAAHPFQFQAAAKLFEIPYFHPQSVAEFASCFKTQSCIIEVTTEREENRLIHEQLQHAVRKALTEKAQASFCATN